MTNEHYLEMAKECRLTLSELKTILHYDESIGRFMWIGSKLKTKNGCVAGTFHKQSGYRVVTVNGNVYREHRLVWFYVHGEWPQNDIDHINGIRDDNRISNLRCVKRSVNIQNQHNQNHRNVFGMTGVHKHGNKYGAKLTLDYKTIHLGDFNTPEEAHKAYIEAKRKLHEGCTI